MRGLILASVACAALAASMPCSALVCGTEDIVARSLSFLEIVSQEAVAGEEMMYEQSQVLLLDTIVGRSIMLESSISSQALSVTELAHIWEQSAIMGQEAMYEQSDVAAQEEIVGRGLTAPEVFSQESVAPQELIFNQEVSVE